MPDLVRFWNDMLQVAGTLDPWCACFWKGILRAATSSSSKLTASVWQYSEVFNYKRTFVLSRTPVRDKTLQASSHARQPPECADAPDVATVTPPSSPEDLPRPHA